MSATATARIILKAMLSIPIAFGLAYPLVHPSEDGGVLGEMDRLGTIGGIVVVTVFLALVYAYASDLRTTLKSVNQGSRAAEPNSVWLMFLLPYNFIEDFFIISNVAKSLEAESRINPALSGLRSFGRISGIGWCLAQVVSLIPDTLGSIAGGVAVFLWVWHWVFVRRANKMLAGSQVSVATLPGRTGS
ncbi:hypothetical protein [Burkholderia cepacia]|uniref:hypothetical protein n=1 Tax=Burkholderia cepacia TaxID=292 RepID=UPI00158D5946|nr:hypothetical protein [Burkholderia cepacia]